MFTPEEQEFKCMMAPEAFAPVPNAWGKRGATTAILSKLTMTELEDAQPGAGPCLRKRGKFR